MAETGKSMCQRM